MQLKGEKGFTLVEVIVVAAIIAILAGILVPMIFSQIDEAKLSRGKADIRSLSSGIYAFRKDVGQWPNCNSTTFLRGLGKLDVAALPASWDQTSTAQFSDHLMIDDNACYGDMWKGPYFGSVDADPWGNAYITNAAGFSIANQAVLLVSAGPDGIFQTGGADAVAAGDDIAIRVK
ncbi:MAG: prepilin-type N-terminal cleavage/methylation domain-containing protein [Desulfobulbaceae bacterium]|nr:prepilin-type N-terminal cleavage/methylation domain-containing protein [Desulfobulbaceae bacterium]